jgi:acyl-CoA reductase-like NAD-dependent aldehyde dehydrogenase
VAASDDDIPEAVAGACAAARAAWRGWSDAAPDRRAAVLRRLAELLLAEAGPIADEIVGEVAKPVRYARGEVARGAALIEAARRRAEQPLEGPCGPRSRFRYRPLGVVAQITPWNNPLAIPLGKIVPALLFGNTVVWKPSPLGSRVADRVEGLFARAGCPPGVVARVDGGAATAEQLVQSGDVDAVAFTGSILAGLAVHEACARRHLPLQAELGGNNAAIVRPDADFAAAAAKIAEGAFGFAGQRCTANRRVVVEGAARAPFEVALRRAIAALACGDPRRDDTVVGPLISAAKRADVARRLSGATVLYTGAAYDHPAYHAPVLVLARDASDEIVQQEAFGPVLVLQPAEDFDAALALCNGVPQGLAAALFTRSATHRERFLRDARAGILKLDDATADADAEAPFGGWKASGVGPPEHGASNREFYTRTQAVYGTLPGSDVPS